MSRKKKQKQQQQNRKKTENTARYARCIGGVK